MIHGRGQRYLKSIGMAFMPKDWQKVKKSHSAIGNKYVDHAAHLERHPAPEEYQKFVESPTAIESRHKEFKGVRGKAVHNLPTAEGHSTVMTKPYHASVEKGAKTWFRYPISGWSTMVTREIFKAAELGTVGEDVSTHMVDNVPVTVHKFGKDFETVNDAMYNNGNKPGIRENENETYLKKTINQNHVMKIAIIDFLTGNIDRHSNNVLVGKNTDSTGHHPILAIDHERSFQYIKHVNQDAFADKTRLGRNKIQSPDFERPVDYLENSGLIFAARANGFHDPAELKTWWESHGQKIKNVLTQNLTLIKDQSLRDHIKRNFLQRCTVLDEWIRTDSPNGHEHFDIFSKNLPMQARNIPKPAVMSKEIDKVFASLPSGNPEQAIEMLAAASEKSQGYRAHEKIFGALTMLLDNLPPNSTIEVYDKFRRRYTWVAGQKIDYHILNHIEQTQNRELAKAFLQYDGGLGKIQPFWFDRLKTVAGEKDENPV
jgi:hypothetical protein